MLPSDLSNASKSNIQIWTKQFPYDSWSLYAYGDEERFDGEAHYLASDAIKTTDCWNWAKLVHAGVVTYLSRHSL